MIRMDIIVGFVIIGLAITGLTIIFMDMLANEQEKEALKETGKCTGMYTESSTFRCLEDKIDNLTAMVEELKQNR